MRVFFLSERPAALFLGGAYLGIADGFERSAELRLEDEHFVEFKPLGGFAPFAFRLDEDCLIHPPEFLRIYYTAHGVALYAHGYYYADPSLKVLKQTRIGGALLTLCLQGKLTLNFERDGELHLIPLSAELADADIFAAGENYLIKGSNAFALIGKDGALLGEHEGKVLRHSENSDEVEADIPLKDCLLHTARCVWRGRELTSYSLRAAREVSPSTLFLALLESVLIGADVAPFLSEELNEKADSLKSYLGNFVAVTTTNELGQAGLVYRRNERIFDVRYFQAEIEEGKIANLSPVKIPQPIS